VLFVPESGFALEQEANKYAGSQPIGDLSRNDYGDKPFLVLTLLSPDYSLDGRFKGQTVMLWDRRRSVLLRSGPGDPVIARERGWPLAVPFHAQGHQEYTKLVKTKGKQRGQLIYLWAQRVGDCIELEFVVISFLALCR
jgi:hypothetical protein